MRNVLCAAVTLGWLVVAVGPTIAADQAPAAGAPVVGAVPGAPDDYRIGPEDVLHIVVWKNEALTRQLVVRPDGKISMPLVNDVQAAGLTPMQLRDDLVKKFTEFMNTPEISVIVQEVRSFQVSVLGQVLKPERFNLRSRTTVLDIIALAGGFKDFAAPSRIVILRVDGKSMKRIPFNYNKVITAGGESENIELKPSDIVLVP